MELDRVNTLLSRHAEEHIGWENEQVWSLELEGVVENAGTIKRI